MSRRKSFLASVLLVMLPSACPLLAGAPGGSVSLAGRWRFQLDRTDAGISEGWFGRRLPGPIRLPGSLPEQGIGDDVTVATKWTGTIIDRSFFTATEFEKYRQPGNVKVPFWLQPKKYYAGVAWFQRDVQVTADSQGKRFVLFLERPHWETRLWVDGRIIGTNQSLSTPHEYDLGQLGSGRHTLTIRVDNRRVVDIGENSHAISDHTQGNWNGIVGKIELRTTPLVWIEDLQAFPHFATKSVTVKGRIGNATSASGSNVLCVLTAPDGESSTVPETNINVTWGPTGGQFEVELSLGQSPGAWNEFNPSLFRVAARFRGGSSISVKFGLREISIEGTQFTINGRKAFIRGTLECCIFPKTGHPPTEVAEWKRIIGVAKSHGLNLFRFHSYCPPEAAFAAADELGFYFQVETCWPSHSTSIGDGKPVDQWVYDETDRILKYYGNHPSFLLMAHGVEPGGRNQNAYLSNYVRHFKALDPRRLWTSGSGWPEIAESQFHVLPDPRIQAWGGGLKSRINAKPPETATDYRDFVRRRSVPVISDEIGEWCVYPNFDEISKYTGYLKPKNFEIFRAVLNQHGMDGLAKRFLLASGKLQALCYKEDIESALRTRGLGGFQLLDLHDFPGQGTALVGVLDPFWEEKGYVTPREYRRFCNQTVPLARLVKRVFTTDDHLMAEIEIANFGPRPIDNAVANWKLVSDGGRTLAHGAFPEKSIPVDNGIALGKINVELKTVKAPCRMKLVVELSGGKYVNDWDVWVYPAQTPERRFSDVLVTSKFDAAAQKALQSGGKVLLTLPGNHVRNFEKDPVKLGYSSIFWNTAWTHRQAPTTLGILCDPQHPALAEFPTDFYTNWQWWYLIHSAGALRLDLLPPGLSPIVRVIDDWFTARPLGLIVEGSVGAGKIIICGFDLSDDGSNDPVSRQMRLSLVDYMTAAQFAPKIELTAGQILDLTVAPAHGEPN